MRRLADRIREIHVAAPSRAALRDDDLIAIRCQIGDEFARLREQNQRPGWNLEDEIRSPRSGHFLPFAVLAILREKMALEAVVLQRVKAAVSADDHIAAASAVAARDRRSKYISHGERDTAVTAVSPTSLQWSYDRKHDNE